MCVLLISEYALEFLKALRYGNDDDAKKILGGHVMALHQSCVKIKLAFAREAHVSGKCRCYLYIY